MSSHSLFAAGQLKYLQEAGTIFTMYCSSPRVKGQFLLTAIGKTLRLREVGGKKKLFHLTFSQTMKEDISSNTSLKNSINNAQWLNPAESRRGKTRAQTLLFFLIYCMKCNKLSFTSNFATQI